MNQHSIFVNRRKGDDRRTDLDPCKNLSLDLYHRKRRKSQERRDAARSLSEDYYAYLESAFVSTDLLSSGDQLHS